VGDVVRRNGNRATFAKRAQLLAIPPRQRERGPRLDSAPNKSSRADNAAVCAAVRARCAIRPAARGRRRKHRVKVRAAGDGVRAAAPRPSRIGFRRRPGSRWSGRTARRSHIMREGEGRLEAGIEAQQGGRAACRPRSRASEHRGGRNHIQAPAGGEIAIEQRRCRRWPRSSQAGRRKPGRATAPLPLAEEAAIGAFTAAASGAASR